MQANCVLRRMGFQSWVHFTLLHLPLEHLALVTAGDKRSEYRDDY